MNYKFFLTAALIHFSLAQPVHSSNQTIPEETIDYSKLAFFPDRWAEQGVSTQMYPWPGNEIVLLTPNNDLNAETMKTFVAYLDRGWAYYREISGGKPNPYKMLDGKTTIAAVPNSSLTCGIGCGYVGATGIEAGKFPEDYADVSRDARAFPHYYFYEMGRNYYIYGKKHDCFVTGYAVFMRYCVMDKLDVIDNDIKTRRAIEDAIDFHAKADTDFVTAMTNSGSLSEKQPRIENYPGPSDQPVMYASAMLRLRRDYGGDDFTKRFYHALHQVPDYSEQADKPRNAQRQCVIWLLTANYAARRDLSPLFVDSWRLELSPEQRKLIETTNWESTQLELRQLVDAVLALS